jgi:hypothetical protein
MKATYGKVGQGTILRLNCHCLGLEVFLGFVVHAQGIRFVIRRKLPQRRGRPRPAHLAGVGVAVKRHGALPFLGAAVAKPSGRCTPQVEHACMESPECRRAGDGFQHVPHRQARPRTVRFFRA